LTPIVNTVRFDTAAVGGFGSLEASLPGDVRRRLAYLGATRVYWGDALLWEGQLEDIAISLAGGDLSTTIRCFGLRRKLEEVTLRRVWSKRDWDWAEYPQGEGAAIIGSGTVLRTRNLAVRTGRFDDSDYSRSGGKVSGNGVALAANEAKLVASASWILLGAYNSSGGALTPTSADYGRFTNIRLLGTSRCHAEDAAGGFYGGTILRDLIALVPGLTVGQIDDGSDFTIQAIERACATPRSASCRRSPATTRASGRSGRTGAFDWRTRNLDEPQWIVPLNSLDSLELQGTTDTIGASSTSSTPTPRPASTPRRRRRRRVRRTRTCGRARRRTCSSSPGSR
jgi:hypothetical protein